MNPTIYAVSSGLPPAAIAVVRVSGDDAFDVVTRLSATLPPPRRAALRTLRHPDDGTTLDRALVIVFPGPATATGEDLAELHVHGGRAVVRAVLAALGSDSRTRHADPGEFTRRALMNGRVDLTEAEGLADLLSAETESQRRAASGASEGLLRRNIERWQTHLLQISARVEAIIDFSDEEDVGSDDTALLATRVNVTALIAEIDPLLASPIVDRLRDGFRIVLGGPPNSGKSTLINRLADRDAAIVSPIAGTTRDRIEVPVTRSGLPFVLIDTAGLAEATDDAIEAIGIDRARNAMAQADVMVWLGDYPPAEGGCKTLVIWPRADVEGRRGGVPGRIAVSAATGEGIDRLWEMIEQAITDMVPRNDVALNARQHGLLLQAVESLRLASQSVDWMIVAEELRAARYAFDRISGKADLEAMLDALFGRFCIGK